MSAFAAVSAPIPLRPRKRLARRKAGDADHRPRSQDFLPAQAVAAELAALLRAGLSLGEAQDFVGGGLAGLHPELLQRLRRAIELAATVGAGAVDLLESLADELGKQYQRLQQLELAFSGPRATARLVTLLPILAAGMNAALGLVNPLQISPAGLISQLLGVGLLSLAWRKCRALLLEAEPHSQDPAEFMGLTAAALAAGCQLGEAKLIVQRRCPDANFELLARHEALALSAGVSLAGLLQALADSIRLQQAHQAQLKISALPNRLMVPIGLTVLPSFVLIAVIPVVLSQFGQA